DAVDLDTQERELHPVGGRPLERHPGQAQEAGRIAGGQETLDERGLDEIEIGLGGRTPLLVRRCIVAVWRLPLHRSLRLAWPIVTDPRRRGGERTAAAIGMMMGMIVIVSAMHCCH